MREFKIIKDKNPLIRKKSVDVSLPLSNEDKSLILNMYDFLKLTQDEEFIKKHPSIKEGVGLAAPQIGELKKMLVIYFKDGENEISHALVNPKIVSNSVKKCYLPNGEGCLSVDKKHEGYVMRDFKIVVEAYDAIKQKDVKIVARGMEAIILQHEIDHLYGILYYDRINKLNPNFIPLGAVEI